MNTLTPNAAVCRIPDSPTTIDGAAIAAHGIGRGDFAALVFSGEVDAIGEAVGYCTWNTPRKFALPDPRVTPDRCLARHEGSPLPPWPIDRVRPTPGVCFVFADDDHPALDALRARDGAEHEHFVVLSRLTGAAMMARSVGMFLDAAGASPIVILGFGDQGVRMATTLVERGVDRARVHVADDRPDRQVVAANAGLQVAGAFASILLWT